VPTGRVHVLAPAPTYEGATAGVVRSTTAPSARAAGPAPTNDDIDAVAAANLRHALATWTSFTG
jgi:stage V sporulation protein SpoVS